MKRTTVISLMAGLFLALSITAQAGADEGRQTGVRFLPDGEEPVFSESFKANLLARVDGDVNTGIVVGVVTPEGTSFFSCGVKSLETMEPVDEHSIFEIGSITKTFTGILLADEVVHGRLSLNTPLQELLPPGVTAPERNGRSIQLVNLANHTSSLPRLPGNFVRVDPANPYALYNAEQMHSFLNSYQLPYDIGTKAVYSNLGMGLLGNTLADLNQQTYEELVVERITGPLGMENTRMVLTPHMEANLARGHRMGAEVPNWDFLAMAGAGALRSDAVDMLKFMAANMGLNKCDASLAMELSHHSTGSHFGDMSVGLGWINMNVEGEEIIWHNGGTAGYMSFAGFLKDGQKGVVVLSNTSVMPDDIGIHLLNPKAELKTFKTSIAVKLSKIIKKEGIGSVAATYEELKTHHAEAYDFSESELHKLGYEYLGQDKIPEALVVFKLNVEAYPESWNAHDSYGEALLKNGEEEKAIERYRKSIQLNPSNHAGIEALKNLGVSP